MMEHTEYRLGEICKRFSSGKGISANLINDTGDYPVIGGNGLRGYTDTFNFDGECAVIGRQGAYCGNVQYFSGKGYMTEHAVITEPNRDHNAKYLTYKLGRLQLGRFSGQAAQPGLSVTKLARLRIEMPPKWYQDKIASILSTYDDLIEVNNKRIKVLEQMAENLYKEWFVRYHFPGHENSEFVNGIPKGWKYRQFADVYSCIRGVSYSSDEIDCDEGNNLINLKNIQSYGGFRRDGTKKYSGQAKTDQIVNNKDLLMGVTDMTQDRRTVGAVALVPRMTGVISADLVRIISNIPSVFSYCLFRWGFYSAYISQFGNGANVIHLKPDTIKNTKILIPKDEIIRSFVRIIEPLIDQIEIYNDKNDRLVEQRSLLLPRLMSGKIEV